MQWIAILHTLFEQITRNTGDEPTANEIPAGSKGVVQRRESEEENCAMCTL